MSVSISRASIFGLAVLSAAALSSEAAVSLQTITVGTSTAFPSSSANGSSLAFASTSAAAGGTLATGASQGASASTSIGETFTGVSGNLSALTVVDTGGGGTGTYVPFLLDLGVGTFNTTSSVFNPSLHPNLLTATTVTPSGTASQKFLEFDVSGVDAVALIATHSYAFGIYNNNNLTDINLLRSSGVQSDANGDGFTISGDPGTSTASNASPFSGSVRNVFVGVYTATPEPSSLCLLGLGGLVMVRRRRA